MLRVLQPRAFEPGGLIRVQICDIRAIELTMGIGMGLGHKDSNSKRSCWCMWGGETLVTWEDFQ